MGTKKKSNKPKKQDSTEVVGENSYIPALSEADNTEGASHPVHQSDSERCSHLDLLLAKQTDELTQVIAERDSLRARIAALSVRIGYLIAEKEQLQLELNRTRNK